MHGLLFIIGLALFLLTLPGTIELLLLTLPGLILSPERLAPSVNVRPRLAVVIPAHDEEHGLPLTINSLLSCNNALLSNDLFVIADNCTDNTALVAQSLGCSVLVRQDETLRGKGYALNFAFNALLPKEYDAYVIVDADTVVQSNFLDSFRELFASGADAGQSAYLVGNANVNLRTRLMHIAFLAFNYLRPLSRHNLGFSAGILGNGFALSRECLFEIPYDSFSIVEDLEYHTRLVKAGKKVQFLPQTTVWSDMPASGEEARSQRERWEGGRFRVILDQVPRLLGGILSGRLRLIEPLLELLLLPLTFHIVLLALLFIISSGWQSVYAVGAFLLIFLHVIIAMLKGKASLQDWKALLTVPFYMLWKIINLRGILKAVRKGADWKRTSR
jgi:cellulose synthase/poly-beta-1,6-N-acetylglucosamine synthase-like glycosyltransferase